MLRLEDLGFNEKFEKYRTETVLENSEPGRVVAEHRERYVVKTVKGEFDAEITGNMRFTARSREDFPAVGDWVEVIIFENVFALIHRILPRFSIIKRQTAGRSGELQVIASNIDFAFIVQAVDRDFNINRIERYLTICNSSDVSPVILLSKTDLTNQTRINEITGSIRTRIKNVPVIAVSSETGTGYDAIKEFMQNGKTYCMLGSSGVGKSTLVNRLSGKTLMRTDTISQSTGKGKHVTSHRELIILENGGILIDNPGMREVGIGDVAGGLDITFDQIHGISKECKFKDCTHTVEIGCSVIEAVEEGRLDRASYENYLKMEKERTHFETTIADRRRKEKLFGKIIKNYKKGNNNNQ